MKKCNINKELEPLFNRAVYEAYFCIVKKSKQLLATLEQDELRTILERTEPFESEKPLLECVVHELINPLLYLRLQCHQDGQLAIYFGIEPVKSPGLISELTSGFLRMVFMDTSKGHTSIDIEKCVRTDWFINVCSEMYEYVEDRNKYHVLHKIPFKGISVKRKQRLTIA